MSNVNTIRYPDMRNELRETVAALSNPQYQKDIWSKYDFFKPNTYDTFDIAIHFLFDDTNLMSDPHTAIGIILFDDMEANDCVQLADALNLLFTQDGLNLTDNEYIQSKYWPPVVEIAMRLHSRLLANDQLAE